MIPSLVSVPQATANGRAFAKDEMHYSTAWTSTGCTPGMRALLGLVRAVEGVHHVCGAGADVAPARGRLRRVGEGWEVEGVGQTELLVALAEQSNALAVSLRGPAAGVSLRRPHVAHETLVVDDVCGRFAVPHEPGDAPAVRLRPPTKAKKSPSAANSTSKDLLTLHSLYHFIRLRRKQYTKDWRSNDSGAEAGAVALRLGNRPLDRELWPRSVPSVHKTSQEPKTSPREGPGRAQERLPVLESHVSAPTTS